MKVLTSGKEQTKGLAMAHQMDRLEQSSVMKLVSSEMLSAWEFGGMNCKLKGLE